MTQERLHFPELGSTNSGRLFPQDPPPTPTRQEGESEEDFQRLLKMHEELAARYRLLAKIIVRAKVVDLDTVQKFRTKLRKVNQEERARIRDLRKKFTKEENPELFEESFSTDDGEAAIVQVSREIMVALLDGLDGFTVGEGPGLHDIATVTDTAVLIKHIERAKWHLPVMDRLMALQRVTGDQLLS